jgi:hypothetical protein
MVGKTLSPPRRQERQEKQNRNKTLENCRDLHFV